MKRLYSHYFPTPSYLSMSSCAIDISDQSIKYGELVPTSNGLRLGKYGKRKIPNGVVVSGKVENESELIKILKEIKEKEKLHFIRVSLPEQQTYLFTLKLPKNENENIRDMILLQMEEHIPLKALDTTFNHEIVSETNDTILVEVVAIASQTIESYLSVFDKAGLIPVSFELEAQAISRAVIPSEATWPVMIVDFGDARTGISITVNGRVLLTTTLSIGGADLTNMIAKNFSLTFEEAEKMKHEYGLDKGSKARDIFPAILNGISVLRDEINKQSQYWETHSGLDKSHSQINHIILCGGDANLAGLSEYLELSMKLKVDNANVWVNIVNPEDSIPEMSFEESLGYATVLGLSLGAYTFKSQSVINVLPYENKKELKREYWMRYGTVVLNFILMISLISTLLLFPAYFLSSQKERLVEQKLEAFDRENPTLIKNDINKIVTDINTKLEILSKAEGPWKLSERVINNILENRIQGITYSQILYSKKGTESLLEIRGVASSRDTLRNFKTILDNNPNFSRVDLPISNFLEKSNLNFTILITLK